MVAAACRRMVVALGLTALSFGSQAADTAARIEFRDGALRASGSIATLQDVQGWQAASGPGGDTTGFTAGGDTKAIRGALATPLRDRGGLAFWFRTDRAYRSGRDAVTTAQTLVEVADTFAIRFTAEKNAITLMVAWGGDRDAVAERHIRIILPEFPGPEWHHVAVNWDAAGAVNAFLDGTPYYVPGEKVAPLATLPAREAVLHAGGFALADVRLSAAPWSDGELRELIGRDRVGRMDRLLGAAELGSLSVDHRRWKLLYTSALAEAADVKGWRLEGPGLVAFRDGWMEMKSQRPDGPQGHLVHWCPENFPDRIAVEFEFELLAEKGLCILFFAANGQGGRDLFDPALKPRSGVFEHYINSDIDCYHISYFANAPNEPRRVANLRKNSGFFLLSNGPVGLTKPQLGQPHRALLIKDGPHIQMAVDGHTIIDYVDDGVRAGPVYTGGKIGFRQMQWTTARYRDLRVHALK